MKVLYITTVPSPYKCALFEEMGKECELTVVFEMKSVSYRDENWMQNNFRNYDAIFLNGLHFRNKSFSTRIVKIIKDKKWDAIIIGVYSTLTQMFAQEWMIRRSIPYYISTDGGIIKKKESGIIKRVKSHFMSNARAWLSTGETATEYLSYYGANVENITVYPFTSISEYDLHQASVLHNEDKKALKEQLGMSEQYIILSVGRFSYNGGYGKGYDTLLRAAKKMNADMGVYIIGDEPTEEFVNWKEKEQLHNVHFVGFKNKQELSQYYAVADIFVLMTVYDVWGLVINEAMSFSLPVITTNQCVAGREMVENGCNGYLLEVGDDLALLSSINNIINNDNLMKNMKMKSYHTAQNYTIEKMAKVHIDFLNRWTTR